MTDRTNAPHALDWDDEKVARFWNQLSGDADQRNNYFARMVGRGVVTFARRMAPLQGRVLDYGCGPGHLIECLLAAGIPCEGVDFSPDSVAQANARFRENPLWRGAQCVQGGKLPYPDGNVDFIFCLETIEHVLSHHLDLMFSELARVIKRGSGRLIITTPNAERLAANHVCCPDCGAVYHRYQHVHSWNKESLVAFMDQHGFRMEACDVTDFSRFQNPLWPGWKDISPRRMARIAWSATARVMDAVGLPGSRPGGRWLNQYAGRGSNLFWIGSVK